MQTLTHLYGVSKFYAEQYPITKDKEDISQSHDYVVSQFKTNGSDGNWSYSFTVLDKSLYQSRIELKGWSILKIESFHQFNPKELMFEIQDPKGVTNKDAKIIQKTEDGTKHYISFPGLGIDALNAGLCFFLQLTNYLSWDQYLQSSANINYSNELSEHIKSLENAKKELEEKMEQIKKLLG